MMKNAMQWADEASQGDIVAIRTSMNVCDVTREGWPDFREGYEHWELCMDRPAWAVAGMRNPWNIKTPTIRLTYID